MPRSGMPRSRQSRPCIIVMGGGYGCELRDLMQRQRGKAANVHAVAVASLL